MSASVIRLAESPTSAPTAEQRVFWHWVYMMGKSARRTALGPNRLRAIRRALELYDEDTLLLAIEGCAASRWHAGDNDRQRAFQDIELILRDEAHIERFADDGEALRVRAAKVRRLEAQQAAPQEPEQSSAELAEQRAAIKALADRLAGRIRG